MDFVNSSKLLNTTDTVSVELYIPNTGVYIPLLDDEIRPDEVDYMINKIKSRKSAGKDLHVTQETTLGYSVMNVLPKLYDGVFNERHTSGPSRL